MARLTKAESEKRKADIAALLAKDEPWAGIVEKLGCSFQTIALVKNGSDNRSETKALAPASDAQDPRTTTKLRRLYSIFDAHAGEIAPLLATDELDFMQELDGELKK